MREYYNRLKKRYKDFSLKKWAKELNLADGTVKGWLYRKKESISQAAATKLVKYLSKKLDEKVKLEDILILPAEEPKRVVGRPKKVIKEEIGPVILLNEVISNLEKLRTAVRLPQKLAEDEENLIKIYRKLDTKQKEEVMSILSYLEYSK
jgi:hypothetical protein